MAYADLEFYIRSYFGDVLTEDNAERWLDRASDTLDTITSGRLTFAFPTVEAHGIRVRKAVCAMAEAMQLIEQTRSAALPRQGEDGTYRGAVASVSSGTESIHFATGGGSSLSVYATAAASKAEQDALLLNIAAQYLSDIPDCNGINLLYRGVGPYV